MSEVPNIDNILSSLRERNNPWSGTGKSAANLIEAQAKQIAELESQLNEFHSIVNESIGVVGFHRNGEVATWEYLGLAPPQEGK